MSALRTIVALLLLSLSQACGNSRELIPEQPLPPPERSPLPQACSVSEEEIPAPAPSGNSMPPQECHSIRYLRFRPATPDGTPKEVSAILIMLPGYLGGAGSFGYLARQLVSLAEQQEAGSVEVWALDRRANCCEDSAGMDAAQRSRDPDAAVRYYYGGAAVNGSTFHGFLTEQETPYLSEFGLGLVMQDIWTILTERIPAPQDRGKTVFIAGHSLGASLSAAFAGWDFDNDTATTADAGFRNCAGLIGLDGSIAVSPPLLSQAEYDQQLHDLRRGTDAAAVPAVALNITPEAMAVFQMLALYAACAPEEESTFFKNVRVSGEVERLIEYFIHKGMPLTGPTILPLQDLRFTNEALLALFSDDNFMSVGIGQASLGFLSGGPVIRRNGNGRLLSPLGIDRLLQVEGLFAPAAADNSTLYTWTNFDAIGTEYDPDHSDVSGRSVLTTMHTEVSDIQDFARLVSEGPLNFYEWYYPRRLSLDLRIAAAPFSTQYGLRLLHQDAIAALPKIEFFAQDITGYNHLDVLCAAADRPQRRKNEILQPLLDFVLANSRGTVLVRQ